MTKLRRMTRRKSIFITILISYIAILLFPVAAGVYLYQRVETIMVDNANRTNLGLLEQITLVVEDRFKEVDSMAVQLAFNPKLQWSLSNLAADYARNEFELADIMNDFRNVNKVSSFIYDFLVYFKNTDTILTPFGKSDSSFYFNKVLQFNEKSADWVKSTLLAGSHYKTYLPVTSIKEGERISNVLTYVQSLPLGETENVKGYLVVIINEQEFDRLIKQIENVNQSEIYIVDDKQQVIMTTAKQHRIGAEQLALLGETSGYRTFKQSNEAMMLSYTTGQNGWKFVSVVPMQVVLKQVNAVKDIALLMLLFILIGGIVASYVMTYRNYTPIRDVVRTIMKENDAHRREDTDNELDYIKQSIVRTLNEKAQMDQTLKRQAPVIQANFLSRLVKGHIDRTALDDDSLAFMGIHFESDTFGVIVLEIEGGRDDAADNTEQEWANIRLMLSNACGELLGKSGFIVEMDRGRLAILLGVSSSADAAKLEADHWIKKLQAAAALHGQWNVTIAVSPFHQGLANIGRCYREALVALDYRMIKGANAVIYHEEIAGLEPHFYHYQLEDEVQLMNFAKSGDYASAERLLDHIYAANFRANAISPEMAKFLLIDLLSTIVKVVGGMQIEGKRPFETIDPAKVIAECATADEMIRKTKDIYRTICTFMREEKTEHGAKLYGRICRHIDEHYADNGLSLSSMADHFQISMQYLSTFFKRHSGENITDYIAAVRIREAKKLLADSSMTIGDIAVKIGYANAVGFVRFFKKVEGLPPGKYREMLER